MTGPLPPVAQTSGPDVGKAALWYAKRGWKVLPVHFPTEGRCSCGNVACDRIGNPLLRIALCGYSGEHEMPDDWAVHSWDAGEGFGSQSDDRTHNGKREVVWFSPHCLSTRQRGLFG